MKLIFRNGSESHLNHILITSYGSCVLCQTLAVNNSTLLQGAHGVVVSHPPRMRKALDSIPSVSMSTGMTTYFCRTASLGFSETFSGIWGLCRCDFSIYVQRLCKLTHLATELSLSPDATHKRLNAKKICIN